MVLASIVPYLSMVGPGALPGHIASGIGISPRSEKLGPDHRRNRCNDDRHGSRSEIHTLWDSACG